MSESGTSAEEALEKAKAIAARLSGGAATTAVARTAGSGATTGALNTAGPGHKRKRWGVMPTSAPVASNVGVNSVPATASGAAGAITANASAADGLLPGLESAQKRLKLAAGVAGTAGATEQQPVQKRVWVSTSDEKPPIHFAAYLSKRLPDVIDAINGQQQQGAGNSDKKDDSSSASTKLSVELKGRGSSSKPPLPGMPEEPLHLVFSGLPGPVAEAQLQVEKLLMDAEAAPLEEAAVEEKKREEEKADPSQALAVVGSSGRRSGSTSYRPASVAQLIGQANLPPEAAAAAAGALGGDWLEEELHVPNGVVGFIIGRGGENISSMQVRTGCKVQIQKEHELQPGQTTRKITLQATNSAAIEECKQLIQSLVQDRIRAAGGGNSGGSSTGASNSKDAKIQDAISAGHVLLQVKVPDADVGLIIGKMGATIKSIQDQTGASVQVPQATSPSATETAQDGSETKMRTVNITHPTEQGAAHAKQMIEDLLKSKPSYANGNNNNNTSSSNNNSQALAGGGGPGPGPGLGPGQVSIQVAIPDRDVGLCIGRQGCVIRQMQSVTNTRIQIPGSSGETHRMATIVGSAEACNQVRQFIERIVHEQSSACVMSNSPSQMGGGHPHVGGGAYMQPQQQQQQQQHLGPQEGQQAYSAEWAAYHAAQQAAAQQAAAQQQQQQQQQQQYQYSHYDTAAQVAQQQVAAQVTNAGSGQQQQPAADAYYEQFFRYAYYYGEEAARKHYGAWSPPVGTPNPYGVNPAGVQPAPGSSSAPASAAASVSTSAAVTAYSASAHSSEAGRETSRRKMSNLPAWMTKGQG